jgi:hypothetical protein
MTGFKFVMEEGIDPRILKATKYFCKGIRKLTPIRHVIGVRLVNQVKSPKGVWTRKKKGENQQIWGGFASPQVRKHATKIGWWKPDYDCMILIPARIYRRGLSKKYAQCFFYYTIMHEIVHYIQFRDKKKLTERKMDKLTFRMFDRWEKMAGGKKWREQK